MSSSESRAGWVFEHAARETLIVRGPDRLSWLNGLITCDVAALGAGEGEFGLALSRTGKVHSDLWLVADDQSVFLSAAPGTAAGLLTELGRMLVMEDAQLTAAPELAVVSVHGPGAEQVAQRWTASTEAAASGRCRLLAADDWLLFCPRAALRGVRERDPAALGSEADWQALRIEHGLPLFGVDYDSHDNPHDASLERRAVSWSKGCYLGQEVVCMQDMRGKTKRRLVPLLLSGAEPSAAKTPVVDEAGQEMGIVTSSAAGRGRVLVMARLGAEAAGDERALFVAGQPASRIALAG